MSRSKADSNATSWAHGLSEAGANLLARRWALKKQGNTGPLVPDVEAKITIPVQPDRDCGCGEAGGCGRRD